MQKQADLEQMENCQVRLEHEEENPDTSTALILENDQQDVTEMEEEIFGNSLLQKQPDTLRILFMNINSIPVTNKSPKNAMIFQSLEQLEGDIVGFTEVNRY